MFTESIVKCECGAKILLVPDLKAVSHAIEEHSAEHGKKEKDPAKAAAEVERIQDDLIAQVLRKVGKSETDVSS
jgi:hypothetical protein